MGERGKRKSRVGLVVSDKMDKSVVVKVQRQIVHPKYGRTMRLSTRYAAHDEKNECGIGDTVRISETRPLSKTKRWRVVEVVQKAV
ncbi:MAG: 30S ribosomal protein S17 [Chitinivibrionales bacterium]|nr:30S ribosomal protein S17 [Chitinivibrionales bacterium]